MCRTKTVAASLLLVSVFCLLTSYVFAEGGSGGEVSATVDEIVVTEISLTTNHIIYDPIRDQIFASIPSSVGAFGNSIALVDPSTGWVSNYLFVGSEPNKLAISDNGEYLYVGLDGAGAIRRVDLAGFYADIQFYLGMGFCGVLMAEDMVVLKDNPHALAVSRRYGGCSPRHEGVAIYDDGVQRTTTTPGHTGSNVIEPSNSASVLYGLNNETTEFGFRTMSVGSWGVSVMSVTEDLIPSFSADICFADGLIYATTGRVIDPTTSLLIGTYAASGPVCPDSSTNTVYFAVGNQLRVFSQDKFVPLNTFTIPDMSGSPGDLIKIGHNRFAFRTDAGELFLVELVVILDEHYFFPSVFN